MKFLGVLGMCPIQLLTVLDADMATYIHDHSDDEFTHQDFLNTYLISKPVDLEKFRTLPGSTIDCSPCQGTARRRTVPSPRMAKGLEISSRILSSALFLLRGILRWR